MRQIPDPLPSSPLDMRALLLRLIEDYHAASEAETRAALHRELIGEQIIRVFVETQQRKAAK